MIRSVCCTNRIPIREHTNSFTQTQAFQKSLSNLVSSAAVGRTWLILRWCHSIAALNTTWSQMISSCIKHHFVWNRNRNVLHWQTEICIVHLPFYFALLNPIHMILLVIWWVKAILKVNARRKLVLTVRALFLVLSCPWKLRFFYYISPHKRLLVQFLTC